MPRNEDVAQWELVLDTRSPEELVAARVAPGDIYELIAYSAALMRAVEVEAGS
jgi:hypothetical protein